MGLRDELFDALGGSGGVGSLLGGVLGSDADDEAAEKATGLGLEAILGGLARNAGSSDGADAMLGALQRDHDGSVLDDVASNFGSAESTADGDKILGHVFGGDRDAVTRNLAGKSGLDAGSVAKLLPALAPMVMGMLGRKARDGDGLDAGGLGGLLGQEAGGFDLGDTLGAVTGSGGGGLGGLLGKLKGLLGR